MNVLPVYRVVELRQLKSIHYAFFQFFPFNNSLGIVSQLKLAAYMT